MYILSQIIGSIAVIVWSLSIQNNKKKKILVYQIIASLLYSFQYLLLNAYSACLIDFTTAIRSLVFYKEEKKNKKISNSTLIFFTIIIIIIGIITYNGILSTLAIIATLFYMFSVWQDNLKITRYLFMIAGLLWLFYNLSFGAYVNIIGNIIEISSSIVSIIRFKKKDT